MVNEKIEILRERLNNMMTAKNVNRTELLRASEELDLLIVDSMKEQQKRHEELNWKIASEIEIMADKLKVFKNVYQFIRFIDPVRKNVYDVVDSELMEQDSNCFSFWRNNTICDNCISMRALNENDAIFKLEVNENKIYLVTAFPVTICGKRLVVEMIKDASNSMLLSNDVQSNEKQLLSAVEYMNQMVVKDPLTELYNRRYILERLQTDILSSSLKEQPLSFIFVDVDHFKNINDTYGYTAGDYVLTGVSEEIKKHLTKEGQWAARYGGDEFFLCLPGTDKEEAYKIAKKIHKGIEGKNFVINKQLISVTCSFVVESIYNEDNCITITEIIELADRKVYKAKNRVRNIVI